MVTFAELTESIRKAVLDLEHMIEQRFETSLSGSPLSIPTRRQSRLDELDRNMDLRDLGMEKGVDRAADVRREADRYMTGEVVRKRSKNHP